MARLLLLLTMFLAFGCGGGCRADKGNGPNPPKTFAEFSLKGKVASVDFSPDGKMFVAGLQIGAANEPEMTKGAVQIWELASQKERIVIEQDAYVNMVKISPDGKFLAVACGLKPAMAGEVKMYSILDFTEKVKLKHQDGVIGCQISTDGKTIATVSYDRRPVRLWDVSTASEKIALDAPIGSGNAMAFSPDSKRLFVGCCADSGRSMDNGVIKCFDTITGKENNTFPVQSGAVEFVTFCPDGKTLLVKAWKTIQFWDAATGKEVKVHDFTPPGGDFGNGVGICFSPDGKTLAITGNTGGTGQWANGFVVLWDFETGKQRRYWKVKRSVLPAVAFSPNGKILATGGYGLTSLKLWEISE